MNGYTIGWLAWITWFVIEEGSALISRRRNASLSAHIWYWFQVGKYDKPGPVPRVRHAVLLMSLAWLVVHLVTGGWA